MVGVLSDSATMGLSEKRLGGGVTPLFSQQAMGSDIQASSSISLDHSEIQELNNTTNSHILIYIQLIVNAKAT